MDLVLNLNLEVKIIHESAYSVVNIAGILESLKIGEKKVMFCSFAAKLKKDLLFATQADVPISTVLGIALCVLLFLFIEIFSEEFMRIEW